RGRRAPGPFSLGAARVEHQPRHVVRAGRGIAGHVVAAKPGGTPLTQLRQREGVGDAAAGIEDRARWPRTAHLPRHQRGQIARVQTVPYLMALSAEADVTERSFAAIGMNPEGENP